MTNLNYANHLGEVESVDQYLRKLRCGIFNKECNRDAQVFFRGEQCCNWDLEPRLYRKNPRRNVAKMPNTRCCSQEWCKTGLRSKEAEMLERLEMMEPEAFAEKPAPIDRLVMARHHGLPTRLLDVTTDPLVHSTSHRKNPKVASAVPVTVRFASLS